VVVLVPQRVGEGLDRGGTREREAVQDEQQVQVAQGQLAMLVEQCQAHPAQVAPEERMRVRGDRRQRRLVGPRWTPGPPIWDHGPESLVDRQRLAVGGPLASHPVDGLAIERVQHVDGALAPSLEHVPIDPRHADRLPGGGVRVVLQPAWRRRQCAVRPCSGRPVQHPRDQPGRGVGDGHGGTLLQHGILRGRHP
jgi:hypothetical protein